ncbi:MAG: TRAP transporter substrate-binding protein [Succinivibrio sp.]|nr:TRAP transporter substrate-binding protein [Succinivibrio sp.]
MKAARLQYLKSVLLGSFGLMALLPLEEGLAAEQYQIRFATYRFDDSWQGKLRAEFIRGLEEASGHRFKVEICEQSKHHNYPDFAAQIETNHMDLALLSYDGLYGYSKKFQALYAPYLFENYELAHQVFDNYIVNWMNRELVEHNICVFGFLDYGYRQFTTRDIDIKTPDDLKNLRMAVAPLPGMNETTAALGAEPVNIEFTQIYDSLKSQQVVGQENTLSVIDALRLYEVQNRLILSNHVLMTMPLLVNLKFFNSIPQDLQQILREQITALQERSRAVVRQSENEILASLKQHGMQVISPEIPRFIDHVDQAYQAIDQAVGDDDMMRLLFEINRARFELRQEKLDKLGYGDDDDDGDDQQ